MAEALKDIERDITSQNKTKQNKTKQNITGQDFCLDGCLPISKQGGI